MGACGGGLEQIEHGHGVCGGGPLVGVLVPALLDDGPEPGGLSWLRGGEGERALVAGDGLDDLHLGLQLFKGDLAGVDLEQEHAEGVDVGRGAGFGAVVDLRGQPAVRSDKVLDGLDGAFVLLGPRGAEIGDLGQPAVHRDKDVQRLHVSVDETAGVEVSQAGSDADGIVETQKPREILGGVLQDMVERALEQLDNDERGVEMGSEELDDIGMAEGRHGGDFLAKVFGLGVGDLDVFDRHILSKVLAAMDGAETAGSNRFFFGLELRQIGQQVRGEEVSRKGRGRRSRER